jgi:NAD-dependent DNA ligase
VTRQTVTGAAGSGCHLVLFDDVIIVFQEDLLSLPLFGPRKADNALAAIEKSRNMDLATLLTGLGIE